MKTKLEIGKEYWLSAQKISRGIYLGESNSGNFDFRITLGSKYTKPLGELDVMTSNLSVYSEYIPEKPWQFTTPIAMKCTEEQFNGIKDKLVEIGYKTKYITFCSAPRYIATCYENESNLISDLNLTAIETSQTKRINTGSFNPDLFLALAAMTDKEDGIKGECFKCVDIDDTAFGSLYIKTKENFSEMFRLDEKELVETGFDCASSSEFRKATAQEIIEHFEKKEFVLPERWCVKVGDLNTNEIILKWRRENTKYKYYSGSIGYINCDGVFTEEPLCTEITFDQFKKYVLKETRQYSQIIPIPPTKQATLFDDRVEITDWKPKDGQLIYYIIVSNFGNIKYRAEIYNLLDYQINAFKNGFIKRTESEAKQLVEKLKQAML